MARRRGPDPAEHDDDCLCPPCLLEDLNRHLIDRGVDPAEYPVIRVTPSGRLRIERPESARLFLDAAADRPAEIEDEELVPAGTVYRHEAGTGVPSRVLEDEEDAYAALVASRTVGAAVAVRVAYLSVNVWARFAGRTGDGQDVVMSGAIVAGPTVFPGRRLALLVDGYRGGGPQLLMFDADAVAELVDDPADHAARAAHGLAPAPYGRVRRAAYLERQPPAKAGARPYWRRQTVTDPDAAQLDVLEHPGHSGLLLHSVHRDGVDVPGEL